MIKIKINLWSLVCNWKKSWDFQNVSLKFEPVFGWTTNNTKIWRKDLSLCNKLWYSNPFINATQSRKPLIFQTIDCVRSNNQSLKY